MKRVRNNGRDVAYRIFDRGGDGPPVCCIHGSGGTGDVWKAQSRLSDRFPVVALDLAGHGGSDDIETDLLRDVIDSWRSGDPVE